MKPLRGLQNSLKKKVLSSQKQPNSIGTEDGREFLSETFTNRLKIKNIKRYSIHTSLAAFVC